MSDWLLQALFCIFCAFLCRYAFYKLLFWWQQRRSDFSSASTFSGLSSRVAERTGVLVKKPWSYISLLGADNSLGYTAPTTPDPPNNFAGDSLSCGMIYGYGGKGAGSNERVHMVCLGSVLNSTTNAVWAAALCCGEGVSGSYRSASDPKKFSGATGFSISETSSDRFDSSDPALLREFLDFSTIVFPSTYRCVILWGHSYAWSPDTLLEDRHGSKDGIARFMPIENCPLYPERSNKSLCSALAGAGGVDVLGFDSCMGMSVENLYILRRVTKIIVGNCDYTGWDGMNQLAIGNVLRKDAGDALSPWELAKVIVDNYGPQLDGTLNFAISAFKTDIAVHLRNAVCEAAYALIQFINKNPSANSASLIKARQTITWADYNTGQGGNGGVDELFADATRLFLVILLAAPDDAPVQLTCQKVIELLMDADGTYSYRHASDSFAGLAAVNFYFPASVEDYVTTTSDLPNSATYASLYACLSFNTDKMPSEESASWSDFLALLFSPTDEDL